MVTRPRLITAIRKLSQYHQTSGLEAKHSLDNLLASKNIYFSYHSLSARLVIYSVAVHLCLQTYCYFDIFSIVFYYVPENFAIARGHLFKYKTQVAWLYLDCIVHICTIMKIVQENKQQNLMGRSDGQFLTPRHSKEKKQ